ncbi:MAG: ABC transporter permease [Planctomycetes bacterium]|nr:ABC transporter permease [Planctomycetota bacterium]
MPNAGDPPLTGEVKKITAADIVYAVLPFLSLSLLVFLWMHVSGEYPDLFPSIGDTWRRFLLLFRRPIMRVSFPGHILVSLRRILIALLAAWTLGIAFGAALGWNRKLDAFFGSMFELIRPIPPLAWIPLITIWFGIGEFPKILIVFIGAVMPVVINTRAGMKRVEKQYLDVGIAFNAGKRQMLLEVAMPSAFPAIFAGVRTSTSVAWSVVLAAEMVGANAGIGFLVVRGMEGDDMPLVLVAMITIGVIGALLAVATAILERMLCPWQKRR